VNPACADGRISASAIRRFAGRKLIDKLMKLGELVKLTDEDAYRVVRFADFCETAEKKRDRQKHWRQYKRGSRACASEQTDSRESPKDSREVRGGIQSGVGGGVRGGVSAPSPSPFPSPLPFPDPERGETRTQTRAPTPLD